MRLNTVLIPLISSRLSRYRRPSDAMAHQSSSRVWITAKRPTRINNSKQIPKSHIDSSNGRRCAHAVHPNKHAHGLHFVLFRFGVICYQSILPIVFHDYFAVSGTVLRFSQYLWNKTLMIWVNKLHESIGNSSYNHHKTKHSKICMGTS